MTATKPSTRRMLAPGKPPTWDDATQRLAEASTYWLATVSPQGRPHSVPVLAVWAGGRLHFSAGSGTRKARDLAERPACVITAEGEGLDVVVEGEAKLVRDTARLRRVAQAYLDKYGWSVEVRDGAFTSAAGAPTAGPPPYDVYEIDPEKAFAFTTDGQFGSARWSF